MKSVRKLLILKLGVIMIVPMFASTAHADQPFMRAALANLKSADSYLKEASADKGGYRVRAREIVGRAIAANNGIAYDQQNPNNRPRRNSEDEKEIFNGIDMRQANQQNMINARAQLQSALANLQKASADAMNLVRDAIQAVNDGIAYDNTH